MPKDKDYKNKKNINSNKSINDKKNKKKKKKKFRVLKTILIILLLIAIALAGFVAYSTYKNGWGAVGILKTLVGHDSNTVKDLGEFRVLILGVSTDISAVLTDTIIVASYNPEKQTASLLSIPRDTFVGKNENNANSYNKINALYQTNIETIMSAVNDITGLGIEYYMVIDTEALIKLVDTIGGVEFDVPIDMNYDDSSQDLHIHLSKGLQKLNGEQAEGVVRFRHNNNGTSYPASYGDNDIGRMRTQRAFITQVAKQTIQLQNITKIGELLDIAYKYVKTNVSLSVAKNYIPYILEFDADNIKTGTVPGTSAKLNGLWFYKYNKAQTQKLVQELFETEQTDETDTQAENEAKKNSHANIKIELVNGSGTDSTLTAVETLLKKQGYTVSKASNISSTTKNTTIINNKQVDKTVTEDIKEILNVGIIQNSPDSVSTADITVIIGTNYND